MPPVRYDTAWRDRWCGLAVLLPCLALLLVAAGLTPNPQGYGTHTQLNLEPCGFEVAYALPCATCGMTTAFALAADGRLIASFVVQPAGMVLAILTAMGVWLGAWALIRGLPITKLLVGLWRPRVIVGFIALILLAWMYTASRRVWLG